MAEAIKIKEVKVGNASGSQIIILPKTWTDDVRLKPGDRLDVLRDAEDNLIIRPPRRAKNAEEPKP